MARKKRSRHQVRQWRAHQEQRRQREAARDAVEGRQEVLTRSVQTSGTFPALSTPSRKPKKRGTR
jgi:hypothetical protein